MENNAFFWIFLVTLSLYYLFFLLKNINPLNNGWGFAQGLIGLLFIGAIGILLNDYAGEIFGDQYGFLPILWIAYSMVIFFDGFVLFQKRRRAAFLISALTSILFLTITLWLFFDQLAHWVLAGIFALMTLATGMLTSYQNFRQMSFPEKVRSLIVQTFFLVVIVMMAFGKL